MESNNTLINGGYQKSTSLLEIDAHKGNSIVEEIEMKEDGNSEELTKLQSELNQWREKYKNMRGDNEELQDKIDELEKSAKGKGSLSEAEQ